MDGASHSGYNRSARDLKMRKEESARETNAMITNKPLAPLQQPVMETQSLYRGEGDTCETSSTTSKERSHLLNDKTKIGDNRPKIFPLAPSPPLTDLLAEPSTQSQPVSGSVVADLGHHPLEPSKCNYCGKNPHSL
ncbi:hypothetical protein ACOMHN_031513 [Nucella lapillus]